MSENRLISSEEKGISSEIIVISSEEMRISSEEMPFSSEFGEQRKEKKYISIYISFYFFFSIARVARVRKGSKKSKRKPTKKAVLSCGRKMTNHMCRIKILSLSSAGTPQSDLCLHSLY